MSVVLNGSSQFLYKSSFSGLSGYPCSIAIHFKPDDADTTESMGQLGYSGGTVQNILQARGSVAGDYLAAASYVSGWALAYTTTGFVASTWQHGLAVFNSSSDRRVYIGGGSKGTNSTTKNATPIDQLMVGARDTPGSPADWFKGKLAHVAVWSIALSDADAALLASGRDPRSVQAGSLVGYWPLATNGEDLVGEQDLSSSGSPSWDSEDQPTLTMGYVDFETSSGGTGGGDGTIKLTLNLHASAGGVGGGECTLVTGYVDFEVSAGGVGDGEATLDVRVFENFDVSAGGIGNGEAFMLSHVWLDEFHQTDYLVVAGNDQLWFEDIGVAAGQMVELVAARDDIDTSDQLVLFPLLEKVFVVNGTRKKVADFGNVKITTGSVGTHYPDRGNILTDTTSNAQMVVDYITSTTGACTIYGKRTTTATFGNGHTVTGKDDDNNDISFTLNSDENPGATVAGGQPHWYDWTPYGNDTAAFGTLPNKIYLGCAYQGRAVWSGDPDYPFQWGMSRQHNPFDFNYAAIATDVQRAMAGGTGNLGELGDMCRALIPWKDDSLAFGCVNSFVVLRGNPADGGYIENIDTKVGVFGQTAWCFDNSGDLYFWGSGGVHKSPRGFGMLENLTAEAYPDIVDVEGAGPATHRILFGHDPKQNGIEISVTKLSDGSNSCYWYDIGTKGFYQDQFNEDHGIYSMLFYDANNATYKHLLAGCKDGYIRYFDKNSKNDDGLAIDSYVDYGPIQLTEQPDFEGLIYSIEAELGGGKSGGAEPDSNNLVWRIWAERAADTINEKLDANVTPNLGGTFKGPGRRKGESTKRRVKGVYAGIKLRNNTLNESWAFEKMIVGVRPAGRAK